MDADEKRSETYPLRRRRVAQALLQDRRGLLVVAGLATPEFLIEVEAMAARG